MSLHTSTGVSNAILSGRKLLFLAIGGVVGVVILLIIIGSYQKKSPLSATANPAVSAANLPNGVASASPAKPKPSSGSGKPHHAKPKVSTESQWVTYSNSEYGISFRYPRIYELKEAEQLAEEITSDGAQGSDDDQGEIAVARVEISQDRYPQTDFLFAALNIGINRYITEEECENIAAPEEEDGKSLTQTINGAVFHGSNHASATSDLDREWKTYTNFSGGMCYEVELSIAVSADTDEPERKAERKKIWTRLESIFHTLKITPIGPSEDTATQTAIISFSVKPEPENDQPNTYRVYWHTSGANPQRMFLAVNCVDAVSIFKVLEPNAEKTELPCSILHPLNETTGSIKLQIENRAGSEILQELRLFAEGTEAVSGTTALTVPPSDDQTSASDYENDSRQHEESVFPLSTISFPCSLNISTVAQMIRRCHGMNAFVATS